MPCGVAPPSDRWCARCAVAVWDTPGFTKKLSAQQLAEKRLSEIKNGRLAMIGMVRSARPPAPPAPPHRPPHPPTHPHFPLPPLAYRDQRLSLRRPPPFALRCRAYRRPVARCTPWLEPHPGVHLLLDGRPGLGAAA